MKISRRRDEVNVSEIDQRATPLSSIWAQVTSHFGAIFAPDTTSSTSFLDVSTSTAPAPTRSLPPNGEMTTRSEVIPISTVTVRETSLSTTFITIRLTTDLTPTYATVTSTGRRSTSHITSSTSSALSQLSSTTSTESLAAPTLATSSVSAGIPPAGPPPDAQDDAAAATAGQTSTHGSQKHAIIGGLSGSIAGVVFLGLIACLLWRRRKPRFDDDEDGGESEKGIRPVLARKWTDLTSHTLAPRFPPTAVSRGSTPEPEPDDRIIRVSLENWARPYAHDQGYRESQGPTTLRVMNPDLSRPSTPMRPSLETAGSFLKRQRNALAAALYGGRPSSRAESPTQRNLQVPTNQIDPALSREFLAPKAVAPSVRSGSTNASTAIIVQQTPEDPFLTPPDEGLERTEYTTKPTKPAVRPGIAPLQGAAATSGGVGRTLSHLGTFLRTRSNASSSAASQSLSRHSTATFSSAGDPFHLQPGSNRPAYDAERGRGGGVMMYEGT